MKRLFVSGAQEGHRVVSNPSAHHLIHVLRVEVGDELEVFDGAGTTFAAKVERVEDGSVLLTLSPGRAAPPLRPLTVVQGLPKGDKLDWVLQKGTELGATAFAVALCERTVVKLAGKESQRQARWQRIADEAARQCGRADVPVVHAALPLLDSVRTLPEGTHVLVLDESERATTLSAAFQSARSSPALALVVGPEGGLARGEVDALVSLGAVPVTLGRLVLRTETAALAALAVLRHLDGDLG